MIERLTFVQNGILRATPLAAAKENLTKVVWMVPQVIKKDSERSMLSQMELEDILGIDFGIYKVQCTPM